ncbi:MAG: sterol desaturase family protein [Deltaproteobacteria bacterium]|nr:sterol desaturase family protein [Deltaproteobacteria bacterium]
MTYDWQAALTFFALMFGATLLFNFLLFKVPAFAQMREVNRAVDRTKLDRSAFRDAVKINNRVGLAVNLIFYVTVLPFCIGFVPRSFWNAASESAAGPVWWLFVQIPVVLLVFDFMYYWTHRSIFHGNLLRKVHALHHQARKPTYVDALYVHPVETTIGLLLFLGSMPIVAAVTGVTLNLFSMVVATFLFTQLNTLNHVYTRFPAKFPFSWIDYITGVHASHHIDMNHGNYATLTMFYDKLFGTFEEPVHRPTA